MSEEEARNQQAPNVSSYSEWLRTLEEKRSRVARPLMEAAHRREAAAEKWKPEGARISGLEELLNYLDSLIEKARAHETFHPICQLVERMVRDFETAVESGLSGYIAAASDCMRDVMEATDLLLLFSTDVQVIDE